MSQFWEIDGKVDIESSFFTALIMTDSELETRELFVCVSLSLSHRKDWKCRGHHF
jgi:hypothetical protein